MAVLSDSNNLYYPIGYAIGTHETPTLIKAALRNAAKHTKELFGQMYRTHQLQSDRYQVGVLMSTYEVIADKVTPARAKNAKAKPIESFFSRINKKWCQLLPNWSGFGITSGKDKQPNTEALKKHNIPDFEGVCRQVEMIMERERAEKVAQYKAQWETTELSHRIELRPEHYLLKFGESTGRTVLLRGTGLHPTIMGQRRDYDCFDVSFRDHVATKWQVRYDPDNLEYALAVNEDETLMYMLEKKYVQPMALSDRKEGDSEQLQRVRAFDKQLEAVVTERRAISGNIVRDHMSNV